MAVNKVILIGYSSQPTAHNEEFLTFALMTAKKWKDKDGVWQEQTQSHSIAVAGKQVNWLKDRIRKGGKVYVEGELQYREKGGKVYTQVMCGTFSKVLVLDGSPRTTNDHGQSDLVDDHIPF